MSLSPLPSLHCFSSSNHQNSLLTISKSKPKPIIPNRATLTCKSNSNKTQFDQGEHQFTTRRRTALFGLSVLIAGSSATLLSPALMASASALPESGPWPRPLDSVIRVLVPRPPRPQNRGDAEKDVEILVVNGVEVKNNRAVKFDVYIDKPYGDGIKSTNSSELGVLAGSLVDLARLKGGRKLRLNLCLDWVLEEIGAVESPVLLVSLVPRMGSDITIGGVDIEYIAG
ncbi:hypothetical protein Scep_011223 [Stephania cephalantha]|uniref:Polyphenol oxidase C-terminal domain-containing protein n=1 Tax=Stephania cephalantha TaxID=152367 RepID=A0AAP0P827_9MAGN